MITLYRVAQKKVDDHAVCGINLRKLLLNKGFIRVEYIEIRSGYDKELISFAVMFMLNTLCDVIHDVIDKHVYI